ncbi:LOW QUALITY PROTEIN: hypothetical protein HID58_047196, partial [Brassica napus]
CFVMGYFMNDALHISSIHSTVNKTWSSPGKIVLFRVDDAHRKLWHISEVPLVLNEWTRSQLKLHWISWPFRLNFLSLTAGKFVKLYPTTDRSLRLDVARVLVEVDLEKPLPRKIFFKGIEGHDITVGINFPWLPPNCGMERTVGFSRGRRKRNSWEMMSKASRKWALLLEKLLNELKKFPVKPTHLGDGASDTGNDLSLVRWVTFGGGHQRNSSPPREHILLEKVASPNSFQILQGIREEGETVEEDDMLEEERNQTQFIEGRRSSKWKDELRMGQGVGQQGKGKGRSLIANSGGLVSAVTKTQGNKFSSRRNK